MSGTVHRIELALVVIVEPAPHGPGFIFRVELDGKELHRSSWATNTAEYAQKAAEKLLPELARYQIQRAEKRVQR